MSKWYNIEKNQVVADLNSSFEGISDKTASELLKLNGYNKLKEVKKRSIFLKFLDQFKNVMIIILLIAAALSTVVSIKENEPIIDTIIILVVVFLNALLGVMQESKAEKAIEALKNMSLPYIKVKRDNRILNIKVEELVVGDIVLIEAGDYIPADMRIIENHSLKVEEAALTGESVPVDKDCRVLSSEKEIPLAERINMLYSGSSVVYGRGEAIVVATGMNTELGKIADAISKIVSEETPLQKKMKELSRIISFIVVIIAIATFILGIIQGKEMLDVFMLAIALAVAAIPEGLSAVITITLAIGVQKMANQKSIIRKLSAVEALGSTEVICSDKTGTLTQNKMTVRKIYYNNELYEIENDEFKKINMDIFSKAFTLCNDTKIGESDGKKIFLGDPTEIALVSLGEKINIDKEKYEFKYKRVQELPFDSVRKMMTTVNKIDDTDTVFTKGAIESVLNSCNYILINDEVKILTEDIKKEILQINLKLAKEALRILAFAYKIENVDINVTTNLEENLIFLGLTCMIDPPRPEAKDAVAKCFEAGMIPVMITGDNIDTASAIAKELGIITDDSQAVTGLEVDAMSDAELIRRIQTIKVYARVSPENKIRIVKAWKSAGKTVAMTGDGVNDAPALKGADIGIGMGITGTEVSKSVSSMILADDNFSTIVVAVQEGRRIYNNIQNVIVYLLASNLAEVLIIFIATIFSQSILLPIQILWINLISDTIPAITLGFEKEQDNIMKQKPRKSTDKFFDKFLITRITVPAIIKTIIVLAVFNFVNIGYGPVAASSASFITLANIELLFAFVSRSDRKSILSIGIFSNKPMVISITLTLLLQTIIFMFAETRELLRIAGVSMEMYAVLIIISLLSVIMFEITKLIIARCFSKE